jgi:23S rRNA (cytosine1962-C5)-methyltransferase
MTPSYQLLDFGRGERLERWGAYLLIRPDPTAEGLPADPAAWESAHARYAGEKGKGEWVIRSPLPEDWTVPFDDLLLHVRLAPFKHTGVFPEQQANWRWMRAQAGLAGRPLRVLNLFGYTGGATAALAKDAHAVTHVDAAKPTVGWAKENAALNAIPFGNVRWMLEDAPTFAAREGKRGKTYDGIVLDPPAYGHGQAGKTWRVERDLAPLLEQCARLLTPDASFLVLNGYAHHDTPESFTRLLTGVLKTHAPRLRFRIETGDLALQASDGRSLSTGIVARCAFQG